MTLMTLISDSQIVIALVSAFVTGILALRLGRDFYR
jgi:photosystem I reaction center subunit XII